MNDTTPQVERKYGQGYYETLSRLEADIERTRARILNLPAPLNDVSTDKDLQNMMRLARLMQAMETRDPTSEEIDFALGITGTWLDPNYWKMYCYNVGHWWAEKRDRDKAQFPEEEL